MNRERSRLFKIRQIVLGVPPLRYLIRHSGRIVGQLGYLELTHYPGENSGHDDFVLEAAGGDDQKYGAVVEVAVVLHVAVDVKGVGVFQAGM